MICFEDELLCESDENNDLRMWSFWEYHLATSHHRVTHNNQQHPVSQRGGIEKDKVIRGNKTEKETTSSFCARLK